MKSSGEYEVWIARENLNVAITGICEVFDLHTEKGLSIARDGSRPETTPSGLPIKRYRTYRELIHDPDIVAVMIALPTIIMQKSA